MLSQTERLQNFKVGDFVYYTDYGRFQDDPELNGYGNILEIKEIQKHSQMPSETMAIIQTKFFEDGTPCEWKNIHTVNVKLLTPAQTAVERHERELQRQLENMKEIRKEFTDELFKKIN